MCLETTTTYPTCKAVLVQTKICLEHITHTALQIDNEQCKKFERISIENNSLRCYCKVDGGTCARARLMSKENGHSWIFQRYGEKDRLFKEQRINEGKARNQRDKDQRRANEEREAAKSEQKKRPKLEQEECAKRKQERMEEGAKPATHAKDADIDMGVYEPNMLDRWS